jgi:hypothetical protein
MIPSLQAYLLVSSKHHVVTLHTRQNDGWFLRDIVGIDSVVTIEALGIVLPLTEIYENVVFKS